MWVFELIKEIDNNLDAEIDYNEFLVMYKRIIFDKNGQEPRSLFQLV